MKALEKVSHVVGLINDKVTKYFTMWLIFPLIFAITYEVIVRYLFNSPTIWAFDLSWMLFGAFICLAFGFVLKEDAHVKADVFYNMFPVRVKRIIDVICYAVFFFPVMYGFCTASYNMMMKSWAIQEASRSTIWAPPTGPIRTVIFISSVLLLAQGIVIFINKITELIILVRKGGGESDS